MHRLYTTVVLLVLTVSELLSLGRPASAQLAESRDQSRYLAWFLADRLTGSAFIILNGGPRQVVDQELENLRPIAAQFRMTIPPIPATTGDQLSDLSATAGYLTGLLQSPASTPKCTSDCVALFRLGVSIYVLFIIYDKHADQTSLINGFVSLAETAELPNNLLAPLVYKVRLKAPGKEVRDEIVHLDKAVAAYLKEALR